MLHRQTMILVLAAVVLVGAGVGVVLGRRAAEGRIQVAAKPAGDLSRGPGVKVPPKSAKAVNPLTPAQPKPADAGQQVQSGAPAITHDKGHELAPADKSQEKSQASRKETPVAVQPSKPVESARTPDNDSDLVFVLRKDLLRTRNAANEAAAIASLRSISSAQAMAQVSGVIDTDGDQQGEYATFGELCGSVPCRAAPGQRSERMEPPILSAAFGAVSQSGNAMRSGYLYRIYLPGPTASNRRTTGIPESAGGGIASGSPRPDANNSEILWSLYAWPLEAPTTGARAFFINQEGDLLVLTNADGAYSGEDRAPAFDAAFPAVTPGDMAAPPVPGAKCNDGHVWSALDPGEAEIEPPAELGPATQADLELNKRPDSERVVVSRSLMRRASISTNEAHAIQMLRALDFAQAQMQAAGVIDTDEDSKGEYAYFAELAGVVPCRSSPGSKRERLEPAVLSAAFGKVSSAGNLVHSGYVFRIYLPGQTAGGRVPGVAEAGGGGAATDGARPDHDNCEVLWSVYAWPIEAGKTGARAFFVNQDGDLFSTPNAEGAYSGEAHAPLFDAVHGARRPGDMKAPLPEPGAKSNDGNVWAPAN